MMRVRTPDGVDLRVFVEGPAAAPTILLLHSIGTSAALWDPQVERLAGRFRVVRYDARGHGGSSVPPGEYSLDDLGLDALAVMDATSASRAHVVGLSMGGLVAMWLGLHAPERVGRLVLAHTAPRVGTPAGWAERIASARAGGMAAIADAAIDRWFSASFREREPAVVQRYREQFERASAEGYAGCCAALRDADVTGILQRVRAPTLLVAGALDVATPVADAVPLRASLTGARLEVLEAAHLGNVEQPEEFTRLVEQFLGSDSTPS